MPCTAEALTSEIVPSKLRAAIRQQSGGAVGLGSEWLAGAGQQSWAARSGETHSPRAPLSCATITTRSTNAARLNSATSVGIIHDPSIHDNSILQRSKTGHMTACRFVSRHAESVRERNCYSSSYSTHARNKTHQIAGNDRLERTYCSYCVILRRVLNISASNVVVRMPACWHML